MGRRWEEKMEVEVESANASRVPERRGECRKAHIERAGKCRARSTYVASSRIPRFSEHLINMGRTSIVIENSREVS